jgi:protein-tyrosine phosphatase
MGAIDLHAHVLPGVDDGPVDRQEALALAAAARADGTDTIVATPHVNERYANRAEGVARGVEALNAELATAGIDLRVRPGAEVALTQVAELDDGELSRLTLGGGPYLLVESPLTSAAGDFEVVMEDLMGRGFRLVLAHPERCPAFQREPGRLRRLAVSGVLTSITAGALTGVFGRHVHSFTLRLLEDQLVHNVASDAHDAARRPPTLRGCLEAAERDAPGIAALGEWFTAEVPSLILAGDPVGFPPALPRRRRRRLRFGRGR